MHYIETNVSLEIVQTKGQILKLPEEEEKYEQDGIQQKMNIPNKTIKLNIAIVAHCVYVQHTFQQPGSQRAREREREVQLGWKIEITCHIQNCKKYEQMQSSLLDKKKVYVRLSYKNKRLK